jgi:ELWxxDGT repeat protein
VATAPIEGFSTICQHGHVKCHGNIVRERQSYSAAEATYQLVNSALASTYLAQDFNPAPGSGGPAFMADLNGRVIFEAQDQHGFEPWISDGTGAGTHLLKDVNPLGSSFPRNFTNMNGAVFFTAEHRTLVTLWKTDGTANGTVQVQPDSTAAPLGGDYFTAVGNTLFFISGDIAGNTELWKSDGTAGETVPITQIGEISDPISFNDKFYFLVGGSDGSLNVSDGTKQGTGRVGGFYSGVSDLLRINGQLYFSAGDGMNGIWKSDGTSAGTVEVKGISTSSLPTNLTNVNGTLYFFCDGRLWKSDGTSAGTVPVTATGRNFGWAISAAAAGGLLYFTAGDGNLWESNGTDAGTHIVAGINPVPASSNPDNLTPVGDLLYFTADDGVHGQELWQTDGTAAGTVMVQDINPGPAGSNPEQFAVSGGKLYFTANDGIHGDELWSADVEGSISGTVLRGGSASGNQDEHGRGRRDNRGIPGITVFLDANNNGVLDPGEISTTTDAFGHYHFDGLLPGNYSVVVVVPTNYRHERQIGPASILVRPEETAPGPTFLLTGMDPDTRRHRVPSSVRGRTGWIDILLDTAGAIISTDAADQIGKKNPRRAGVGRSQGDRI